MAAPAASERVPGPSSLSAVPAANASAAAATAATGMAARPSFSLRFGSSVGVDGWLPGASTVSRPRAGAGGVDGTGVAAATVADFGAGVGVGAATVGDFAAGAGGSGGSAISRTNRGGALLARSASCAAAIRQTARSRSDPPGPWPSPAR